MESVVSDTTALLSTNSESPVVCVPHGGLGEYKDNVCTLIFQKNRQKYIKHLSRARSFNYIVQTSVSHTSVGEDCLLLSMAEVKIKFLLPASCEQDEEEGMIKVYVNLRFNVMNYST